MVHRAQVKLACVNTSFRLPFSRPPPPSVAGMIWDQLPGFPNQAPRSFPGSYMSFAKLSPLLILFWTASFFSHHTAKICERYHIYIPRDSKNRKEKVLFPLSRNHLEITALPLLLLTFLCPSSFLHPAFKQSLFQLHRPSGRPSPWLGPCVCSCFPGQALLPWCSKASKATPPRGSSQSNSFLPSSCQTQALQ